MTNIANEATLTMREVLSTTGCARSTLYLMMDQERFPRPCSLPRKKLRWRRSDIENWLSAARQPPPESEDRRQARLDKLARAPRAGQKRRVPQHVQTDRIVNPYHASPLDAEHERALRRKLGLDREEGQWEVCKPVRWHL